MSFKTNTCRLISIHWLCQTEMQERCGSDYRCLFTFSHTKNNSKGDWVVELAKSRRRFQALFMTKLLDGFGHIIHQSLQKSVFFITQLSPSATPVPRYEPKCVPTSAIFFQSVCVCVCVCVCVSVCLSVCLSFYLTAHHFVCLSACLRIHPSICLCFSVHMSIH